MQSASKQSQRSLPHEINRPLLSYTLLLRDMFCLQGQERWQKISSSKPFFSLHCLRHHIKHFEYNCNSNNWNRDLYANLQWCEVMCIRYLSPVETFPARLRSFTPLVCNKEKQCLIDKGKGSPLNYICSFLNGTKYFNKQFFDYLWPSTFQIC